MPGCNTCIGKIALEEHSAQLHTLARSARCTRRVYPCGSCDGPPEIRKPPKQAHAQACEDGGGVSAGRDREITD